LIEIDGVAILTDPLWSERISPVSWAGPKRWYPPPIALSDLPQVDVVVISHDHYDHLDRGTIVAMKNWKTVFVVPLGIGADLELWGIPRSRIIELDWWQSTIVNGVELVSTPARHASGRLLPQSDKTLWSGFAFVGPRHRAYYSGDTGLLPAMQQIGDRYGPFDVTLIEAGQYDADWPDWHLGPEQAIEANRRVRGKVLIPVHWALIALAHHSWTEPVERVLEAARCTATPVMTPRPGQSVEPSLRPLDATPPWWPALPWQSAAERPLIATKNGDPQERMNVTACIRDGVRGRTAAL
jgi:L-ascorbate metabolism protein UlaG (beta-lactamase superfamily)